MSFFQRFPMLAYDITNTENYKLLPDILRRVKIRTAINSSRLNEDAGLLGVTSPRSPAMVSCMLLLHDSTRSFKVIMRLYPQSTAADMMKCQLLYDPN